MDSSERAPSWARASGIKSEQMDNARGSATDMFTRLSLQGTCSSRLFIEVAAINAMNRFHAVSLNCWC